MSNSVNYQHFKTLLNAYKKAYPEKNKNACQNPVAEIWKNMKTGEGSKISLRNRGRGILLTLRTVTRGKGGPNFPRKQRYVTFQ